MKYYHYLLLVLLLYTSSLMAQQPNRHIVKDGETKESIAKKYNISVADLQEANPDIEMFFYVGLKLNVPTKTQTASSIEPIDSLTGKEKQNNSIMVHLKSKEVVTKDTVDSLFIQKEKQIDLKEKQDNHNNLDMNDNIGQGRLTKELIPIIGNDDDPVIKAIQKINNIYNSNFDYNHPAVTFNSTKEIIVKYILSIEPNLTHQLQSHYYEAFYDASDNDQLESAVNYAFIYLMIDGRKDENVMWQVLIDNYGSDGDTENTSFLLDLFKDISVLRENAYTETIESLSQKYEDVIHPISFDDMARGYWISVDDKYESEKFFGIDITPRNKDGSILQKTIPDYILNIRYVTGDEGTTMLTSPRAPWKSKKTGRFWYYSPSSENYLLRTSQRTFCDADAKYLHLAFATEKTKEGNTQRSQQSLASNRQWKADMHGKINSSDTSFGNQLAAGVVTDVTAGLLDALAISMGAGSKTAEGYGIELNAISPKVMNASITYRRVKESAYGYTSLKDYKPNQQNRFVKWEESDSVVFINMLGKPIFIESLSKDSPLLYEYNEVRKKYNFWKPQYLIPSVVSVGVGAACITRGITMLTHDIRENRDLPKDKQKRSTTAEVLYLTVGTTVPIVTIGIISGIITSKRQSAYNKINKKNMDKMRQKAAQFSMQPILDPIDNSIGMNMSVNF